MTNDERGMMNQPDTEPSCPQLPPVPRPVTARARRRSWAELPVRVWLVLTLLIALVTGYFTVTRVREALSDRWLILHGVEVDARFTSVNSDAFPKRRPRNEPMAASFTFVLNGKTYTVDTPRLEAKPDAFAQVGSDQYGLHIKVDPNDPVDHWTEATEPKPWSQELTAVGLLLPLLLILLGITLWKRKRVLRIWQMAPLAAAQVVELRQSAIAPLSRVVHFTLHAGNDRRVWRALLPASAQVPAPGDAIWLLCPPDHPGRAIIASVYT